MSEEIALTDEQEEQLKRDAMPDFCRTALRNEVNDTQKDDQGVPVADYTGMTAEQISNSLNTGTEFTCPRIAIIWAGIPYAPNVITPELVTEYLA